MSKQYKKSLLELEASLAEAEWEAADAKASQAFTTERLQRAGFVRIMQRTEGALLALFPGDRARVRSYFRDRKRVRDTAAESPPAPSAT